MENMPFKVGQLAESKCFSSGFRGAWFRCKIREITTKKGIPHHFVEYYDYPDEKFQWIKIYQVPPYGMRNTKGKHRELMLRPQYPPTYNEKEMPHVSEISEVIVLVCDSWKVGDLVDWMTSGCLWCGTITQVFDDQVGQIELRPPPRGEGSSYRVLFKDLRPSLDWSPEHGWTLPTQEDGIGHPCARLIKPINQVIGVEDTHNAGVEDVSRFVGVHARLLFSSLVSSNSVRSNEVKSTNTVEMNKSVRGTTLLKEQTNGIEKNASQGCEDNNIRKTCQEDIDSRQNVTKQGVAVVVDDMNHKKYMASGGGINSRRSNAIEATIVDLEEYINKVKWLKKMLQDGSSSSENQKLRSKFIEPNATIEIQK